MPIVLTLVVPIRQQRFSCFLLLGNKFSSVSFYVGGEALLLLLPSMNFKSDGSLHTKSN